VKIKITFNQKVPLYKKIAPRIRELKALGMTHKEIAIKLQISRKTIKKSSLIKQSLML